MNVYLVNTSNQEEKIEYVLSGATFNWVADDTLDSATVRFISANKEPLKPAQIIRFKFDNNNSQDLLIASDNVEPIDKHGDYTHTVSCVELTKILEKFFINNFTMTASDSLTLYSQLLRAETNLAVHTGKKNTIILGNISTKTSQYKSEDFNISNATAREVLDEMLSVCDCRAVVTSITYTAGGSRWIYVGLIDLNATTQKTISNVVGNYASNNVDNYNGKMVSVTSNATPQKLARQTDTFKTSALTATSQNRTIEFAYPPEYVTEMNISVASGTYMTFDCHYDMSYTSITANMGNVKVPLVNSYNGTNYQDIFVDKEYWETLETIGNTTPSETDYVQENTLYYEKGKTTTDISRTYKRILFTISIFEHAIKKAYLRYAQSHKSALGIPDNYEVQSVTFTFSNFDNFYYEMTYAPLVDTMVEVNKEYSDCDQDLCVIDGQSASTLDLSRYGRNLLGKTRRIGNNDYIIDCNATTFTDILEPLDYIVENGRKLVVYKTDFQVLPNVYKVRYYLTENYNNLAEKVALAREKRIYEIPLTGYKTIIPLREQIIGEMDAYPNTPSIESGDEDVANSVIAFLGETLTEQNNLKPIENMLVTTRTFGGTTKTFCLPVVGFGCGNTMNFVAKFYDNYSAGLSITDNHSIFDWVGGKKVVYNPYVDNNGEITTLENIKLATSKSIESWCINDRPHIGSHIVPLPLPHTEYEAFKEYSRDASISYYKDRAESLQIQKIYTYNYYDDEFCYLTPLLFEDNNAFISNSNRQLYLYKNCTFKKGQTIRTNGTLVGRCGDYITGGVAKVGTKYNYYIYPQGLTASYTDVIICDQNNRIYAFIYGMNRTQKFALKDERTY